jgi:glucose/arabinose dehydrogenase
MLKNCFLGFIVLLVYLSVTQGATLPTGFTETAITGLSNPTAMEIAPDGRIFVCQQGGSLRVIKNGVLLATPFVTLNVDPNGERGLLGIAFDPNFGNKLSLSLLHRRDTPRHNRVSRFTANGDVVVPGSETVHSRTRQSHFGDESQRRRDPFRTGWKAVHRGRRECHAFKRANLANMLGKVLRINSDGTIPADNPFFNTASGTIDRSGPGLAQSVHVRISTGTGRLFINDVGQDTWEEINDGIAGSNYGWNLREGPTSNPLFRSPLFSYGHGFSATTGCAIAGGAFYNPNTFVSREFYRQVLFRGSV